MRFLCIFVWIFAVLFSVQQKCFAEDDFLKEFVEKAQQQINRAKKADINSQEKTVFLESARSLLREACDIRNDISPEILIFDRHQLFNALKSLAYASIEGETENFDNPLFIEVEGMCREFANDENMPKEVRKEAFYAWSTLVAQRGDTETIVNILKDMMQAYPQDKVAIGHVFFGIAQFSSQLYIEARKRVIEKREEEPISTVFNDQALEIYKAVIKEIPDSAVTAECSNALGLFYVNNRKFDKAISEYEDILSMENIPIHWHAYSRDYMGYIYRLKGEYNKALNWYQSIIDEHPDLEGWHPLALCRIADLYSKLGRKDDAVLTYMMVLEQYPNSPWVGTAEKELGKLNE